MILSTQKYPHIFPQHISNDKNKKHLILGYIKRGEHFGEHSAFNDLPNPYTIEAFSPKVELYKIHRSHFIQYFGGLNGEPLS
jgi:CRP-like cAMP-binding protein